MGVSDAATLDGLARMDDGNAWLYTWVREGRMSEFQFALLTRALAKMVS